MKKILSAKQMSYADKTTSEKLKVPSIVLMERAALSVCEEICKRYDTKTKVSVVCGNGNNGGDGMAIVRLLYYKGYDVKWSLIGKEEKLTQSAKIQFDCLHAIGLAPVSSALELSGCDLLVDAIFGTGLSRNLSKESIKIIERFDAFTCEKLAVDIPSGLNATKGSIMGAAIKCDVTVTFAYEKLGHYLFNGKEYCGELICKDIGIYDDALNPKDDIVLAYEREDFKSLLPTRTSDSHKGTYGRVLVIAGTKDVAGASYLAAKAAYLVGAGLVKIYTPEVNRVILQQLLPEAMLSTYENEFEEAILKKELSWASTILIGPGMGLDKDKAKLLEYVIKNANVPMVIDADALNIISKKPTLFSKIKQPSVITPHVGEMSRLLEEQVFDILPDMTGITRIFAKKHKVTTVLKSSSTVIATPKGEVYLNIYGNNGMSTGGSGDVLAGMIAGLMAQRNEADIAAILGVGLHSLAGDFACENKGAYSMIAKDILDSIHECMQ